MADVFVIPSKKVRVFENCVSSTRLCPPSTGFGEYLVDLTDVLKAGASDGLQLVWPVTSK